MATGQWQLPCWAVRPPEWGGCTPAAWFRLAWANSNWHTLAHADRFRPGTHEPPTLCRHAGCANVRAGHVSFCRQLLKNRLRAQGDSTALPLCHQAGWLPLTGLSLTAWLFDLVPPPTCCGNCSGWLHAVIPGYPDRQAAVSDGNSRPCVDGAVQGARPTRPVAQPRRACQHVGFASCNAIWPKPGKPLELLEMLG